MICPPCEAEGLPLPGEEAQHRRRTDMSTNYIKLYL